MQTIKKSALWLSKHDKITGDFEKSKNIIFHLHGAVGWSSNAQEVMKRNNKFLVDTFQIAPDLWKMPENISTKNSLSYAHQNVTEKLQQVLSVAPKKNIILHGNSFGGSLALWLAYQYSNQIAWVILNSSSGFGEVLDNRFGSMSKLIGSITQHEDIQQQYKAMKRVMAVLIDMNPDTIKPYMVKAALDLSLEFDSVANRYTRMDKQQISKFWQIVKFLKQHDMIAKDNPEHDQYKYMLLSLAEEQEIPFLFLWGSNDTVTPPEVIEYQAELVGQKAIILDNIGHSSHMETPNQWIQEVNTWIQTHALDKNRIDWISREKKVE